MGDKNHFEQNGNNSRKKSKDSDSNTMDEKNDQGAPVKGYKNIKPDKDFKGIKQNSLKWFKKSKIIIEIYLSFWILIKITITMNYHRENHYTTTTNKYYYKLAVSKCFIKNRANLDIQIYKFQYKIIFVI